jgi:hypothetical protein
MVVGDAVLLKVERPKLGKLRLPVIVGLAKVTLLGVDSVIRAVTSAIFVEPVVLLKPGKGVGMLVLELPASPGEVCITNIEELVVVTFWWPSSIGTVVELLMACVLFKGKPQSVYT